MRILKTLVWPVAVVVLFVPLVTQAAEYYNFYNGARGLGMGGCQVAMVNDETALLINPAALGKLRDYFVTVADPEIHMGSDAQGIIGTNILLPLDPQKVLTKMLVPSNEKDHLHSGVQVFPSAVFPNFGIGVFGNHFVNAEVDTTNSLFTYNYRSDIALVFGFDFRLWDGRVKLGFNVRMMNRNEILRDDIPTASTGLTIESLAKEGVGIGSDVGLILAAPWKWLPTLAAVYRDVGDTYYNIKDKGLINYISTHPDPTMGDVDVGFSIYPILGHSTRTTISIEYDGVLTASAEQDKSKRIHAGMEFNFSDAVFLRLGMNQRYWTAGLEFAVANYQLQLSSYGEEIGTATVHREDRRTVVKFAYRF